MNVLDIAMKRLAEINQRAIGDDTDAKLTGR